MFRRQRFGNYYPSFTLARRDPSSFAQRFYNAIGKFFEQQDAFLNRVKDFYSPYSPWLPIGTLYKYDLSETDYITKSVSSNGKVIYTYPDFEGEINSNNYTLNRSELFEDFIDSSIEDLFLSNVVDCGSNLVFSSEDELISDFDYPSKLIIKVFDSDEYYTTANFQKLFSNQFFIHIKGLDLNHEPVEERIYIKDDDIYQTRQIFLKITEVDWEGFNGLFEIYFANANSHICDYSNLAVDPDFEGFLKLSSLNDILSFFTSKIKFGDSYKFGGEIDQNDFILWQSNLLDSNENTNIPVSLCLDPYSGELVTVDSLGLVHFYNLDVGIFTPFTEELDLTEDTYIEIQPIEYFATLDETKDLLTYLARIEKPIVKVQIYCKDPNGNKLYLQDDKSWSGSENWIFGNGGTDVLKTWTDFKFSKEFDVLGEWEFYAKTLTSDKEYTLFGTKVFCHSLISRKDIDTGVTDPEAIFFNIDGKLCLLKDNQVNEFDCIKTSYFADEEQQCIYTLNDFEVTVV